ncbi:hypothetical protein [Catenibacterium sp.]|uniref:hypothetical protein n=1 Tax=Catenibacterium sp. TaxID=2049022 RepID=UPI00399368AA
MSDTYVHEIFDRYVKLDRLPLTDIISIDEVHLDMDDDCKYTLVIQDSHTGDPIDLLRDSKNFRNGTVLCRNPCNKFLFATRQTPVLNGITDYNPVTYYEEDDF